MNKKETMKALLEYRSVFPKAYDFTKMDEEIVLARWHKQLHHLDYELVVKAIDYLAATEPRHAENPTYQIKNAIYSIGNPKLSEGEAWQVVKKALRENGGFSINAWNELPEEIKATIGSRQTAQSWALMDSSQLDTVVASNFMRTYRQVKERNDKYEPVGELCEEIARMFKANSEKLLSNKAPLAIEYEEPEEHEHIYDPERDMYVIRKKEKPVKEMASDLANALSMPSENQKER